MQRPFDDEKIGICVKDLSRRVLEQNPTSIRHCGDRRATVCSDGCMESYLSAKTYPFAGEGIRPARIRSGADGSFCEAVVVNDGTQLVTLVYPTAARRARELEVLRGAGLSARELEVLELAAAGASNEEMARKLFISLPTLRTHLNNAYKKLPHEIRLGLRKRRLRLER